MGGIWRKCRYGSTVLQPGSAPLQPPLEDRRRLQVRRETPASCGLVEATEEDGDDALGIAALPPQPLPPPADVFDLREKVGFTKNTAMRHRRVGGRAVTVTAMLHRQRYRVIEKGKD